MDINRAEREQQRYIVLIDELRAQTSENALVEFKENNTDKEMIGRLCSALANAARVDNQDFAYVVWGIRDSDHAVIGTSFEPDKQTVNNQGFQIWLAQRLKPSIAFSFRTIQLEKSFYWKFRLPLLLQWNLIKLLISGLVVQPLAWQITPIDFGVLLIKSDLMLGKKILLKLLLPMTRFWNYSIIQPISD